MMCVYVMKLTGKESRCDERPRIFFKKVGNRFQKMKKCEGKVI